MNSPLNEHYEGFECSNENFLEDNNLADRLNTSESDSQEQSDFKANIVTCEICNKQFLSKKNLQRHIVLLHLGKPCIVLNRVVDINSKKLSRKEEVEENYLLETIEKEGSLKLTLKKKQNNNNHCDSLKLTLKKSPISESFTVISNSFILESKEKKQEHENPIPKSEAELAELQQNDTTYDPSEGKSHDGPFENVILNQENDYEDETFQMEANCNPLESLDQPLMDNIEGDSGVGSDSINPCEREDDNDDSQNDNSNPSQQTAQHDDQNLEEESVEETCRETIENLKRLGEQSRYTINSISTDEKKVNGHQIAESQEDEEVHSDEEKEKAQAEENLLLTTNVIEELQSNSQITLLPRSALSSSDDQKRLSSFKEAESQIIPLNSSNDESILEDNNDNEDSAAGSVLLQKFLNQHKDEDESSHTQSLETEYVSLEKLAETVNTCKVCNEKFKDIAHLDAHRSRAGHYQCNKPDCSNLIFSSPSEVSKHKAQLHCIASPSISISTNLTNQNSPHNSISPHLRQNSPHFNQNSPRLNAHSPHLNSNSPNLNHVSPNLNSQSPVSPTTSPHSPTFAGQHVYPVNLEQLPTPVQQLAQQVQRMPLPNAQMNMQTGPACYSQPPGRPPLYRVQAPIHYPPHMAPMYSQYPYQQVGVPHPQMQQSLNPQMPHRARYPAVMPNQRVPRMPQQTGPGSGPGVQSSNSITVPRARLMKRPPPFIPQQQQQHSSNKQRRLDVLMPDHNEDADCHIIAQQKRNDGVPLIQNVQGGTLIQQPSHKTDPTIHLTDAITLSIRQPAQVNATVKSTKDASAVANALAARGITVTAAANKSKLTNEVSSSQQQQQKQGASVNMPNLNLNSAVSIIPANSQKKQQEQNSGQFAVPQSKQNRQVTNSDIERPPRPPTVDLTQDGPLSSANSLARRGRPPRMLQSLTCQVCDKRFQSQEMLTQHTATHRTPNKLLHKCNLCNAQYPAAATLANHKKNYHKEVDTSFQNNGNIELALPVVDLKSTNTLARLSSLGIQSYIPLSQLSAQTGGYFALPIVSVDGARNGSAYNLGALGATSILSLGPLKHFNQR